MLKTILLINLIVFVFAMDDDANAKMMMSFMKNDGHHFEYGYDLSNGIGADETGDDISVQGEFHFTTKEGIPVKVTYTADANGFHPHGDMLPTAPPTPPAILRALEYIKTHSKNNQEPTS